MVGISILIGMMMSNHGSSQYTQDQTESCDPSYPDFCISAYSADLDCNQIPHYNFRVLQPDRHGFDQDHDGIGCER